MVKRTRDEGMFGQERSERSERGIGVGSQGGLYKMKGFSGQYLVGRLLGPPRRRDCAIRPEDKQMFAPPKIGWRSITFLQQAPTK